MNNENWVEEVGKPAYEVIQEMVFSLQCDWERLEELSEGKDLDEDEKQELEELKENAGEYESEEDARQAILEDPLSAEVRSDWQNVGEVLEPAEYCLLLATGGPAVRLIGELQDNEPVSARLEVQDWFKPWTEYLNVDHDILLAYAQQFYFGE